MVDNIKTNKDIELKKRRNFLIRFLKLFKKSNVYNFYFRRKVFVIIIAFLPLASTISVLNSQMAPNDHFLQNNKLQVSTTTGSVLRIDESINFTFLKSQLNTKIEVFPNAPIKIIWNDERTKVTVKPKHFWNESEYRIIITEYKENKKNDKFTKLPSVIYTFDVEKKPKILKTIPQKSTTNVILENNNIIRIFFDRYIENYEFFADVSNNEILSKDYNLDNNSLNLVLKNDIKSKQKLDITIFGKYTNIDSDVDLVGKISMKVMPNKPESWPVERQQRLKISSETTLPYIGDGKYIDINLTSHITTLFNDGEIVKQFINSPGAKDSPTITGIFKIENKALKPLSNTFKVYLPYWMAFSEDGMYGLHGLVEWPANHPDFPNSPNGGKESVKNIDKAVSPGCVRHIDKDSKVIYQWAEIGTPVYIYK